MHAGPFEWKQSLLAPKIRVEVSESAISVYETETLKTIALKDICRIYYYALDIPPYCHFLQIEVLSKTGESARIRQSGFGNPNGFDAQECRKAAIAFLSIVEQAAPEAQIYAGQKPSLRTRWIYVTVLAATFVFASFRMFAQSEPADFPVSLATAGIIALLFVVVGWRGYRKVSNPTPTLAKLVRESLELSEETFK